jgi:hypothetical protein
MIRKDIDYECGECLELKSTHTDDTDHEFELGCYCAESGRCEVCVDEAIDYAEYLRDSTKESA